MGTARRFYLVLVFCLTTLAWPCEADAQVEPAGQTGSAPAPSQKNPSVTIGHSSAGEPVSEITPSDRIQLDLVVTDHAGEPVSGFGVKDFTLLDNDQPEEIRSFQAINSVSVKPGNPVQVILLIDAVNQTFGEVAYIRQEVDKFLRHNGGNLAQPVSTFWLTDHGLSIPVQDSNNGNLLAAEIDRHSGLQPIGLDPLQRYRLSVRALGSIAVREIKKPGRKLLVWIGPDWGGEDYKELAQASLKLKPKDKQQLFDTIVEFSTRLREARIALYNVSTEPPDVSANFYVDFLKGAKSPSEANYFSLLLKVLATQSGGRVLNRSSDLVDLINHCVLDASAFYTLSFSAPRADHAAEYHGLEVHVAKPGLTVRTETGYYNQPDYYDQPDKVARRVTVEQLEVMLKADEEMPDSEVATQLFGLKLTERLSSAKLSFWQAHFSGSKTSSALAAIADSSAFLNPPDAEILSDATPDVSAQRQILSRTIDYLSKTIPRLPNFFAAQTTVRYEDSPQQNEEWEKSWSSDRSLHLVGSSSATILIRNGKEVVNAGASKRRKPKDKDRNLIVEGTFGPILSTVMLDTMADHGGFIWSRWEKGAGSPHAVFRYAISEEQSHDRVTYCCVQDGDGTRVFQKLAGYHGEITVDPESGAILRLTMQADLKSTSPVIRSDIMVEYGPVGIGGSTHICPVKSISISRVRTLGVMQIWDENLRTFGPYETMLNAVSFGEYHMFGSESRVLTGLDPDR